jgi:hypothetical protein
MFSSDTDTGICRGAQLQRDRKIVIAQMQLIPVQI